jgi:cell division protein FtsQ
MIQFKAKFDNFLLSNRALRSIRVYFEKVLRPIFTKIFIGIPVLTIIVLVFLRFFKPDFLDQSYQKIRAKFFSKLISAYSHPSQINISGNSRVTNEQIIEVINQTDLSESEMAMQNLIDQIRSKLPWITKIVITRNLPGDLNITVSEFVPFAIWQSDNHKYLIDRDGNVVPYEESEELSSMMILSGKGANTNVRSLFNILVIDPNLSKNVYSATWVGNRRWDIRFDSGLLVKLPEKSIAEAWQKLIKINNLPGSLNGLKIIDLRISDKVYLEYDDSIIKELKSI